VAGSAVALLVTDESLLARLTRLCAVAGHETEVVTDLPSVRRTWTSATAVIVESRLAEALAAAGLGRRSKLAIVCAAQPGVVDWQAGVAVGAEEVVHAVADEQKLLQWLSRLDDAGRSARVIGCVPSVGGAGASTLAIALAQSAAAEAQVTLIDADSCGAGLDLLMGIETLPGRRWPQLVESRGVIAAEALQSALPIAGRVAVVSCGQGPSVELSPDAMSSVLDASQRGSPTVIVDLPRRLCAAAKVAAAECDVIFMVVPLRVRAVVAASVQLQMLQQLCSDVRLVIREPAPADLTATQVARKLGLAVAGVIGTDKRVSVMTDRGQLHRQLCRTVLAKDAALLLASVEVDR
jgi:secretion/DNA translocation related CpaE-like protein